MFRAGCWQWAVISFKDMFMSECISYIYFLIVRILKREYFFVCFFVLVFMLLFTNWDYKKMILLVAGVTGKKQTN